MDLKIGSSGLKSLGGGLYIRAGKKSSSYVCRPRQGGTDKWVTLGKTNVIDEATARGLVSNLRKPKARYFSGDVALSMKYGLDHKYTHDEDVIVANAVSVSRDRGVYFLVSDDKVVYVGQTESLITRISDHMRNGKEFDSVAFIPCAKRDLDFLESVYISKFNPPLNHKCLSGQRRAPINIEKEKQKCLRIESSKMRNPECTPTEEVCI